MRKIISFFVCIIALSSILLHLFGTGTFAYASYHHHDNHIDAIDVSISLHVQKHFTVTTPTGLSPNQLKSAYNLPKTGGTDTIAIITAYDASSVAKDLNTFSSYYSLPTCNSSNPCFEKHLMSRFTYASSAWGLEANTDTQWAHAIAPTAKILLVEARSNSLGDLLNAINYARNRSDVTAISMSWGAGEFSQETSLDGYLTSPYGATFFASSGDMGTGVVWPAASPNVVGVGGTTLTFATDGSVANEVAWSGSGGGVSAYETEPTYQTAYNILNANSKRSVPDVSYDADPASGVAVYDSTTFQGQSGWFQIGGTSIGAPQWAAIKSLGQGAYGSNLYSDVVDNPTDFRDIVSGTNGVCAIYCVATQGYDFITGLGSPLTVNF